MSNRIKDHLYDPYVTSMGNCLTRNINTIIKPGKP